MYVYMYIAHGLPLTTVMNIVLFSCVDMMTEVMDLLEENPTVEFSTLVTDEENFKVPCFLYVMYSTLYVA